MNQLHSVLVRWLSRGCLVLCAGLFLFGCSGNGPKGNVTPTAIPTPTPWPTLVPVQMTSLPPVPADEAGDIPVQTGPVLLDQFRAEVRDDATAVFPVVGEQSAPIRIEVIVLAGDIDPVLEINNQAGDRLALSNNGAAGQPEVIGQFLFPADGYYEVGVRSTAGEGEVGVSIYRLQAAELEGGGVVSTIPASLAGRITNPTAFHTFQIDLERGRRVDIAAIAADGGPDLLFELYGPDGFLLAGRDDNVGFDPYLWNFMPSVSGVYTLVVSNFNETLGDYVVQITESEGGEDAVIGRRTEWAVEGSPRRSTWLTFEGRALDGISVEARPVDSDIDLGMRITDPFGNVLVEVNETGRNEREVMDLVQFPFTGTYHIEFETFVNGGAIDYFIDPISQADMDVGGLITAGGDGQEGEVLGVGTALVYAFDADDGDLIGVDAHSTGGTGLDLVFDLYDPDGNLVLSRDDVVGKDPIVDRVELSASGRYALVLWNFGGTTGPFDVFVTRPDAPAELPDDEGP